MACCIRCLDDPANSNDHVRMGLASGDRQGNLRIHSIDDKAGLEFKELHNLAAHNAEIMTLDAYPFIGTIWIVKLFTLLHFIIPRRLL